MVVGEQSEYVYHTLPKQKKMKNKLGLYWAKLSSSWDWSLLQLVCITQTPSLIVLVEYTNFAFYTFLIQLEIAELALASYCWLQLVIASDQLDIQSYCTC